jgi:hypothetical protein
MAQETQYCSLRYILGTVYSGNTEASEISPVRSSANIHLKSPLSLPELQSLLRRPGSHTNGSRLNHVADGKSLYRLILGSAARAIRTSDRLDVTSSLLVATAVIQYQSMYFLRSPSNASKDRGVVILGCALLNHDGRILQVLEIRNLSKII